MMAHMLTDFSSSDSENGSDHENNRVKKESKDNHNMKDIHTAL